MGGTNRPPIKTHYLTEIRGLRPEGHSSLQNPYKNSAAEDGLIQPLDRRTLLPCVIGVSGEF